MNDINQILRAKYPGFHLVYTDILDVYKYVKLLYARNGTNLYVSVKLPFSPFQKSFKQYQIKSLLVPVNATSPHATQLLDLPSYFVISHNQQYYVTLNPADLINCVEEEPVYCMTNIHLYLLLQSHIYWPCLQMTKIKLFPHAILDLFMTSFNLMLSKFLHILFFYIVPDW